jgi:hypothetical protein
VKLSFREAAANTVTVPDSFGEADAPEEPGFPVSGASEESDEEEQAVRASTAAAPAPASRSSRRVRRAERVINRLLGTGTTVAPWHAR